MEVNLVSYPSITLDVVLVTPIVPAAETLPAIELTVRLYSPVPVVGPLVIAEV